MIKSARKNGGTLCAGWVVQFARNNHHSEQNEI
jgi:hypothetical protein